MQDESRSRDNRIAGHFHDRIPKLDVDASNALAERLCGLERHPPLVVSYVESRASWATRRRIVVAMRGGSPCGARCIQSE
jgi:hypothetical protein